jgi:N-acetyl-gamma-glutamyl-phosphate reductase
MKVSIIGATGYTGFELVKILSGHEKISLSILSSDTYAGKIFSDIYPAMRKIADIKLSKNNFEFIAENSDIVFLCLPHAASQKAAAFFYEKDKIVIDLSADFRIKDRQLYEITYNVIHEFPHLLEKAVYGLPEIFSEEIKKTKLVANPGCYPTSIILPLYPLLKNNLIEYDNIFADSKSGVSGAGKKPSEKTHFCETNEDFKPYGIFSHRHNPEINHILGRVVDNDIDITFTPHLLPVNRGIESTIYVKTENSVGRLKECLKEFYNNSHFIRIYDEGEIPSLKNVNNTNYADINIFQKNGKAIIVCCIDNLIKGASGQAVQNMNLICGYDETEGLV